MFKQLPPAHLENRIEKSSKIEQMTIPKIRVVKKNTRWNQ